MPLTDQQKLGYIIPLVVYASADIDASLVNLTAQLQQDAQTAFDNGLPLVQPQIESILGHPLDADQLLEVRRAVAGVLNPALQRITITP